MFLKLLSSEIYNIRHLGLEIWFGRCVAKLRKLAKKIVIFVNGQSGKQQDAIPANATMIYVPLLEEGTPTVRGTPAIAVGDGLYKILLPPDYNPDDEIWEFLPGSIVRCDVATDPRNGEKFLRAYEVMRADGTFSRSTEIPEKGPEAI